MSCVRLGGHTHTHPIILQDLVISFLEERLDDFEDSDVDDITYVGTAYASAQHPASPGGHPPQMHFSQARAAKDRLDELEGSARSSTAYAPAQHPAPQGGHPPQMHISQARLAKERFIMHSPVGHLPYRESIDPCPICWNETLVGYV